MKFCYQALQGKASNPVNQRMKILMTGGAGHIVSYTILCLLQTGLR